MPWAGRAHRTRHGAGCRAGPVGREGGAGLGRDRGRACRLRHGLCRGRLPGGAPCLGRAVGSRRLRPRAPSGDRRLRQLGRRGRTLLPGGRGRGRHRRRLQLRRGRSGGGTRFSGSCCLCTGHGIRLFLTALRLVRGALSAPRRVPPPVCRRDREDRVRKRGERPVTMREGSGGCPVSRGARRSGGHRPCRAPPWRSVRQSGARSRGDGPVSAGARATCARRRCHHPPRRVRCRPHLPGAQARLTGRRHRKPDRGPGGRDHRPAAAALGACGPLPAGPRDAMPGIRARSPRRAWGRRREGAGRPCQFCCSRRIWPCVR
jgi:hypothetical protein